VTFWRRVRDGELIVYVLNIKLHPRIFLKGAKFSDFAIASLGDDAEYSEVNSGHIGLLLRRHSHIRLRIALKSHLVVISMVLGQKLWEGKGKSGGAGFIKSIDMNGVTSVFTWSVQLKGMGTAKGVDGNLNVTAKSMMPPKGVSAAKDQGILMTSTGDMAVVKGFDLMKMMGPNPASVGLYSFMTMSPKLAWMNDLIALVTFEALDPMWETFNMTIYEWK
jgi:hypothetical protein